jgi:DNA-binding response OmpR family regulator
MLKVLIAEDDLMITDMVEDVLVGSGYEVCGIARTVDEGVALGRLHKPELADIDLRLADDGLGTEIAARLSALGRLGVLYASANISSHLLRTALGDACLTKPYRSAELVRSLQIVADIVATGAATQPLPRGFQLLPLVPSEQQEFHDG